MIKNEFMTHKETIEMWVKTIKNDKYFAFFKVIQPIL